MRCPKCNYVNQPGAKFCAECGTPLTGQGWPGDNTSTDSQAAGPRETRRTGKVVVRGWVTNLSMRQETNPWNVHEQKPGLEFRVAPDDQAGSPQQPVEVRANGRWIHGYVQDKDHVEVHGRWEKRMYIKATAVKNLTTDVTVIRTNYALSILTGILIIAFVVGLFLAMR